jgi:hypothetical protein
MTMQASGVPFFYWPYLSGDTGETPLRGIAAGYGNKEGGVMRTSWDLFSLTNTKKPDGVDLTGDIDFRGIHGPAVGENLTYDRPEAFGKLDSYFLPHDTGDNQIDNRETISFDGEPRGYALWRHRQILPDHWELSAEAAYVSDPTFLEQYFSTEAESSKPYETSLYLKRQEEDTSFSLLASYNLNEFMAQTPALQAPGYFVDRLPEADYSMIGTSLWKDRLTYFGESRAGMVRIQVGTDAPSARGFTDQQSLAVFGIPAEETFAQAFGAKNVPTDARFRFDTRHEIDAPTKMGFLDVVPYVGGRFTGYSSDFEAFNGTDDTSRFWGTVGVRLSTEFSRSYDSVDSSLLDVHRLRHIIQPNGDFFLSGSTINSEELPIYDPDVEAIYSGPGAKFGLRNILQTQRGGEGQTRSVDWLVVNTDILLMQQQAQNSPIARWVDFRPEDSFGGDHFHADVMWMVSDTLAAIGELTESLYDGSVEQWRVGGTLQHSPVLTSFMDYTEIQALGSRHLSAGFNYKITTKYTLGVAYSIDLGHNEDQTIDLTLTRKLSRWKLVLLAHFDALNDENSFGVVLIPDGATYHRLTDPLATSLLGQ